MNITTLHQCLSFPDRTPLECIRVTVKSLNKNPKTGVSQKGVPWSVLNGELIEGATVMEVKFWNRNDIGQHLIGQTIVISSVAGKRGMNGVSVVDNDYQGTVTKQIKVEAAAQVIPQDTGQPQPSYAPPPAWQPYAPQQGLPVPPQTFFPAPVQAMPPQPVYQQPPPAQPSLDPGREAKRMLSRAGGCYAACYAVGLYIARQIKRQTGEDIGQEQFQAMVSSLFIYSDKQHIVDTFEPLDMKGPAPWEEAKTASGNTAVGPRGVTPVIPPPFAGQPLPPSQQVAPPSEPAEDDVPF